MAWIKRNLYFFIGTIVALILIGLGGWYFYMEYTAEGESANKIAEEYDTLRQLNQKNPLPGKPGSTVDNVQAAIDQQTAIHSWIDSAHTFFQPVKVSGNLINFPGQLDNTVAELQRRAADNGVSLPLNYYFTFQAQRNMLAIPRAVLPLLATHLGEINAICGILFDAKINSLEYVRREVLSDDDTNTPDYLPPEEKTISTPLAEITPYEVTFDCFSGELAGVFAGLAASPHSFVVKSIDVEPALPGMAVTGPAQGYPGGFGMPPQGPPQGGGHFRFAGGGYMPPANAAPVARPGVLTPPPLGSHPVTFLNENKLRVTLLIDVIKPKPAR